MILYVASSGTICRDEPRVADAWLDAVRSAVDPAVQEANVLVRPYPRQQGDPWKTWIPRHSRVAVETQSRMGYQGLYDNLYHAAAVVGLNTSAQVEAAVLEKPVYTFAAGEIAPGQEQALHFRHLLCEHGGPAQFGATLEEHTRQLARGLAGDYDRAAIRRFAESFLRPRGLDTPVAPILAAEIIALAEGAGRRKRTVAASGLAHPGPG